MVKCLPFIFFCTFIFGEVTHQDFDQLMDLDRFHTKDFFSHEDQQELRFYREDYLNKVRIFLNSNQVQNHPKTLHFIWLGPNDFPLESIKNIDSWRKYHPTWKIKFWTDDPERKLPLKDAEKCLVSDFRWEFLEKCYGKTGNWGEKSDLLRYEILFQEGGIYIDHDIECFRPFDALLCYDFYAFLEPPHYNPGIPVAIFPTNGLIASKAFHPILRETMAIAMDRWDEVERQYQGPHFTFVRVLNRTFSSFLSGVKKRLGECPNSIVFPSSFLYPVPDLSLSERERRIASGLSFGWHSFAGTWKIPQKKRGKCP